MQKFKTARMFSCWQIIAYICALCCMLVVTTKFDEVSNNAHKTVSLSLGTICLLSFSVMNFLIAIYGVSSLVIHVKYSINWYSKPGVFEITYWVLLILYYVLLIPNEHIANAKKIKLLECNHGCYEHNCSHAGRLSHTYVLCVACYYRTCDA